MRTEVLDSKKELVSEIRAKVENSASTVVVEYRGLSVGEITNLRTLLRNENVEFKVYKNSMFQRAVEDTSFDGLKESLTGPNAVAFSDDAVAPSRIIAQFAKKHKKLVLKAGVVDGKVVNADDLKELATLPNHDGMISMLLGMFQSPIRSFAYAVSQVAEKRAEAEGAPSVEAVAVSEEAPAEEVATEEVVAEAATEVAE